MCRKINSVLSQKCPRRIKTDPCPALFATDLIELSHFYIQLMLLIYNASGLVVYLSRISFIRTGTVLFDHLEQVFVNELKTECFRASKFMFIWTNDYLHACSKIEYESSVKIDCSTFVGNLVVLSNIQNRTFHLRTPPHRLSMLVKVDT